ncbi:hypothetical protein WMY93_020403 [Mugilogobius chulae]|uniref:Carboxylic ester hydrolase n=1 Tax=Mugilogobius chulae TaxID=88201 RepID=A0AAW0NGZ3_9GOBI
MRSEPCLLLQKLSETSRQEEGARAGATRLTQLVRQLTICVHTHTATRAPPVTGGEESSAGNHGKHGESAVKDGQLFTCGPCVRTHADISNCRPRPRRNLSLGPSRAPTLTCQSPEAPQGAISTQQQQRVRYFYKAKIRDSISPAAVTLPEHFLWSLSGNSTMFLLFHRETKMEAVCAFVLLVTVHLISAAKLGVVQTEGGAVEGRSRSTGLFSSVDVFKGIPFADVPKRWEKPQPHPGWTGVLKATKYKERCLQVNLFQTKTQGSEDCLYLNIFVPQGTKLSQNLPVMVYLFGGAFLLGASNDVEFLGQSLYDGEELAHRGNVIVVTVNYRVGTLGFLSSGDQRMPGNYGLWDQHAAISWVKRNIERFGGNPDNMTIFGQSAGAASVSYQMLSPYSKGLFRRAITQGGTALSPGPTRGSPSASSRRLPVKWAAGGQIGMRW